MYAIYSRGALIALVKSPRYVRANEDFILVEASEDEADAIAVNGTLYNMPGRTIIADAPEAVLREADLEEYVFENQVHAEKDVSRANARISIVEDAVCDLESALSSRLAVLEDAICELDSIINRGDEVL